MPHLCSRLLRLHLFSRCDEFKGPYSGLAPRCGVMRINRHAGQDDFRPSSFRRCRAADYAQAICQESRRGFTLVVSVSKITEGEVAISDHGVRGGRLGVPRRA